MVAYELALILPPFDPNIYVLHQIIWQRLLKDRHIDYPNSLLYRVISRDEERMALLRMPAELFERADNNFPIKPVQCPIAAIGQSIFFSVRLCPLYRSEGRFERTPSDLKAWVAALFSRNGFELTAVSFGSIEHMRYEKPGEKEVAHNTRLFSVCARVVDVELAQRAWLFGIGRRKSTGCGLLLEMS